MRCLINQQVTKYGYDNTGTVEYSFNSLGFRSDEITSRPSLVVVGNSISFGIGLSIEQTYGHLVAQRINRPLINLSIGCYFHENHNNLINLTNLSNQAHIFVIQINNLDRGTHTDKLARFVDYYQQTQEILKNQQVIYLYWDEKEYAIPNSIKDSILIYNKFHLDSSLPDNTGTFGPHSHRVIAEIVQSKLQIN